MTDAGTAAVDERHTTRPTLGQRVLYRIVRNFLVILSMTYWRMRIVGKEHVPDGPFVLSPVHRSNIDTPLVAGVTGRRLRYMGKDAMWKHRAPAWLFTALGGFPVRRGTADRVAIQRCLDVLAGGEPVVVFAEGGRRSGPVIGEISEGAAYLATRAGVPIVPVGIGGSERAMTKGSWVMRPVRCSVVIGQPLYPPPPRADGKRTTRREIHELTERLRAEMQRLFDEARSRAEA